MKPRIYLAGPISGLSYSATCMWREELVRLAGEDFNFISPMRSKSHLSNEVNIKDYYTHPLSTQQAIMARDSWDVQRCDGVFVNFLEAKTVSIGTVMECAWAWQLRKPVVSCISSGSIHDHCMLREATPFVAGSIDEGLELLYALFMD